MSTEEVTDSTVVPEIGELQCDMHCRGEDADDKGDSEDEHDGIGGFRGFRLMQLEKQKPLDINCHAEDNDHTKSSYKFYCSRGGGTNI